MLQLNLRSRLHNVKPLLSPYYIANIILSLSYVSIRTIETLCKYILQTTECHLSWYDSEILIFVLIVVVFKSKKKGDTSMLSYLSSLFTYVKLANVVLFFKVDARLCLLYVLICLLQLFFIPEPVYAGPDKIVYFNESNFEEELESDKRITWIIAFYVMWSPLCIDFAPTFAELSSMYHLENLKFGKVDVGRYPKIGEKYRINCSSLSKQLPTVTVFKNGKPVDRRPMVDSRGKLVKFVFNKANIIAALDLNNLFAECKQNFSKKKSQEEKKST